MGVRSKFGCTTDVFEKSGVPVKLVLSDLYLPRLGLSLELTPVETLNPSQLEIRKSMVIKIFIFINVYIGSFL